MIDEKRLIAIISTDEWKYRTIRSSKSIQEVLKETIESMPATGEWIPVSEGLPEEELQPVLVAVMKKRAQASWVKEQEMFYFVTDIDVYDSSCGGWQAHKNKVKAWMPLPEPWEGEK